MTNIVDRKYLTDLYNLSLSTFEDCCGECWCCIRKKMVMNEFKNMVLILLINQ